MEIRFKVNPITGQLYMPDFLREGGYVGEIEAIPNHFVVVFKKPGSTLKQVKRSLEILIKDIEHQMEVETENRKVEVESA